MAAARHPRDDGRPRPLADGGRAKIEDEVLAFVTAVKRFDDETVLREFRRLSWSADDATAAAVRAKVREELLLTLIWKMEEELLATHPNMATRTMHVFHIERKRSSGCSTGPKTARVRRTHRDSCACTQHYTHNTHTHTHSV